MIRVRVDDVAGGLVEVAASGAHHLVRVLRARQGDLVRAFDGRGAERPMRIAEIGAGTVVLEPAGDVVVQARPALDITILQALAKGDKLPRVVRAVTELGATRIGLVVTRRTVSRPAGERAASLALRLSRIASESARQCRRADVPEIRGPERLESWLERPLPPARLAAWEGESVPLSDALPMERPEGIAVLIGPEGGFDRAEVDSIRAAGFATVSLGPRILRTETVAAALCAILQFRYGDLASRAI